ncbi:GSCOCG00011789001-RA-CDS [Cotesia congregata]|nr:GSCOCG00011789001-RA-CDS [Cotesia congregata]
MDKYSLVTDIRRNKSYIVSSSSIYRLNEENQLTPIKGTEDIDDDCSLFVRDQRVNLGNAPVKFVDSDDDPHKLMKRNSTTSRIIMTKIPKYSPTIKSNVPFKPKVIMANDHEKSKKTVQKQSSEFYGDMVPQYNAREDVGGINSEEGQSPMENIDDSSEPASTLSDKNVIKKKPFQNTPERSKNVSSNPSRSRKSRTIIRRPFASLNTNLRTLHQKINNFSRLIQKTPKQVSVNPQQPSQQLGHYQQPTFSIPKLTESILIENEEEFVVIGDTAISAENLAAILKKSTMRQRVNLLMKQLWPPEVLQNMYVKDRHKNENHVEVTNQQCKKIKDLCLYLQKKRELTWIPGSKDDLTIYLKSWIGAFLNEHRRELKKNGTR